MLVPMNDSHGKTHLVQHNRVALQREERGWLVFGDEESEGILQAYASLRAAVVSRNQSPCAQ